MKTLAIALRLGFSEHLGASFTWGQESPGSANPAFALGWPARGLTVRAPGTGAGRVR